LDPLNLEPISSVGLISKVAPPPQAPAIILVEPVSKATQPLLPDPIPRLLPLFPTLITRFLGEEIPELVSTATPPEVTLLKTVPGLAPLLPSPNCVIGKIGAP
jgi:hypothetical protein